MNKQMCNWVEQAFRLLVKLGKENGEQKLMFPSKRKEQFLRYSEQEFKQLFIETFCTSKEAEGLRYSVETPTRRGYVFPKNADPRVDDNYGISGNVDLCIHKKVNDEWQCLHMVEFKAHNVQLRDMEKDLLKLSVDLPEDELNKENFFIHIIYSANDKTLTSLQEKYDECRAFIAKQTARHSKEIIVYLLFVSGVGKEKEPCYYRFNLRDGFNISEFQKI